MKLATKYILKAWIIENILAIITYYIVFFSMSGGDFYNKILDTLSFVVPFFVIGTILAIPLIYLVGEKINFSDMGKAMRFLLGIFLLFILLTIVITTIGSSLHIIYKSELWSFSKWLDLVFIFYLFGGIQTLCVGIWLGYKLSSLKN